MSVATEADPAAITEAALDHALALSVYNFVAQAQQGAIVRQATTALNCASIIASGADAGSRGAKQAEAAAAKQAEAAKAKLEADIAALPSTPGAGSGSPVAPQAISVVATLVFEDAADYVRNIGTLCATIIGAAAAKSVDADDASYIERINTAQRLMYETVELYERVGLVTGRLLNTVGKP